MDDMPYLSSGAPWMMAPPDSLVPDRTASYKLTDEQIRYVTQYWLFWYEADQRYGLPTVAFFLATILFFAIVAFASKFTPSGIRNKNLSQRIAASWRFLSYKGWKLPALRWYSPSAGIWILGSIGAVFFFSMMLGPKPYYWPNTETVNFGNSPPIATRSGWMSIACLPFLLMLSAKENPISLLTRISYEKLLVFHKWVAWAMYILALVHTFPFIIHHTWKGDMEETWKTDVYYWTGVVALLAQTWLQFMSIGFIRNRFYEFFKALHFAMAALFFAFLFIHCGYTLTSWDYLIAAAVLYAVCLLTSQLRTWFEHGVSSFATIETVESGAVKVSIPTRSPWYAGQHIFVRFLIPSFHGLTQHPFTICSLPITQSGTELPVVDKETADMIFYIWPYQGLTQRLLRIAKNRPNHRIRVLLDGPYGGMSERSLHEFDHALVIGGGSGAGFTFPVIEDFLRRSYPSGKPTSTKNKINQLRVIVAFKTEAYAVWYQQSIHEILASCSLPSDTEAIRVDVYVTKPDFPSHARTDTNRHEKKGDQIQSHLEHGLLLNSSQPQSTSESDSASEAEKKAYTAMDRGHRPDLPKTIAEIVSQKNRSESLGVVACGPSSMLFDVREALADAQVDIVRNGGSEIWLYHEAFGW